MATTQLQTPEPSPSTPAPSATSNVLTFSSHPGLLQVIRGQDGEFSSKLVVLRGFLAGEMVTKIEGYSVVGAPRYTTVQVGVSTHVELNSDLVFMNVSQMIALAPPLSLSSFCLVLLHD